MEHDIFFSISQTPDADGHIPDEQTMLRNYFEQLECADSLGFGVGWIAQAHLSTETQKSNSKPVVPHWQGEVGLCTDFRNLPWNRFEGRRTSKSVVPSSPFLHRVGPLHKQRGLPNLATSCCQRRCSQAPRWILSRTI